MSKRICLMSASLALVGLMVCLSSCTSQGQGDLTVFRTANFDFVLPETRPAQGSIVTRFEVSATPGEVEGLGFGVFSRREISQGGFEISDLTCAGGGTIPANSLDTRVVQVWEQKGLRGKSFIPLKVCEGLLKDDSMDLLSPQYTPENLPSIPPGDPVRTTFRANEAKGLYVVIRVPAETAAGDYTGTMRIGDMRQPTQVPLLVHVLPFKLEGPGKTIGFFFNDSIGIEATLEVYRERLKFMREMGVDCLRIGAEGPNLEQELDEIKAAGFAGPIMVWPQQYYFAPDGKPKIAKIIQMMKDRGYEPYLYGVDQPNWDKPVGQQQSIQGQVEVYKITKELGGLTTTCLAKKTADRLRTEFGQVLDYPQYGIVNESLREYVKRLAADPTLKRYPHEALYFGSSFENPQRNRLLAGLWMYNSKLDATIGWTFYTFHIRKQPQVFNDFDLKGNKKRWLTVFPTKEGCSPTLQSEAFREGVDDLRYLNTFLKLADEKEAGAGAAAVRAWRQQVLRSVGQFSDYGVAKPEDETGTIYTNKQFEDTRQLLITAILKIRQL